MLFLVLNGCAHVFLLIGCLQIGQKLLVDLSEALYAFFRGSICFFRSCNAMLVCLYVCWSHWLHSIGITQHPETIRAAAQSNGCCVRVSTGELSNPVGCVQTSWEGLNICVYTCIGPRTTKEKKEKQEHIMVLFFYFSSDNLDLTKSLFWTISDFLVIGLLSSMMYI